MGYRSNVTIVIYGEKDDVTAFLASERLKGVPKGLEQWGHPLFEIAGETYKKDMYHYDDDKYTMMIFRWFDVKWYEDFPTVAYWDNLRSVWEDAFKNSMCMEFARVGEHSDDVECDYYGSHPEYALSIHTEVDEDNMPKRSSEVLNNTDKESKNE